MFQVQAAVAITQSSSTPVLLTVPCSVMGSPTLTPAPWKALAFRAGFDVLIKSATMNLLCAARADSRAPGQMRSLSRTPMGGDVFKFFGLAAWAADAAEGGTKKNPRGRGVAGPGRC